MKVLGKTLTKGFFVFVYRIPTVTATFGQEGDLRQWRNLDENKKNYLLQVSFPGIFLMSFQS